MFSPPYQLLQANIGPACSEGASLPAFTIGELCIDQGLLELGTFSPSTSGWKAGAEPT
jgi:hypothetical protein